MSHVAQSSGYAESYVNPEKKLLFLPISKAGLDHKNPRTWDDYPALDELTRQRMAAIMTPKVYMDLHYNKHTFGQLADAAMQGRENFDYMILMDDGTVRQGDATPEEKLTGRLLNLGARQVISQFVTTVNTNILSGDCGKLSNLNGARFMFSNKTDDVRVLEGFIPYFLFPFEDSNHHISQVYVYFASKLILLHCQDDSQHDNALYHMKETCVPKRFDKMCAWCGKLSGGDGKRLRKCKCKTCRYCSKDCQTKHWSFHIAICKEARPLEG